MGSKKYFHPAGLAMAALCVVISANALQSGCRGGKGDSSGALRYNIHTEPPSLDWSIATDHSSIMVVDNIMEGLTRFDEDLNPIPGLAESWEVSEEGKRYVFHLRRNARWTDGRPVTADDFVYAWQRLLDPATAGEYAYFIFMVENAEAINSGEIKDPSRLGIKALDDKTLEVRLCRPVVYFPMITTFICTFPMRRDAVEKHGDAWTEPENIITCGPYKLVEWRHEYRMTLTRNLSYYGFCPGLDSVIFYMVNEDSTALSLYETGDLDAVNPMPPPSIPSYEDRPEYVNYPYNACYYYGFNVTRPPVDDPLVRAALASAIDRSQLPRVLKGHQLPNATVIPIGMKYDNPGLGYDFDPDKARALLAEAGYPGGKDFPAITIGYNTQESHKMIAELVQQQWNENLGIQVELRNMEWKVFLKELQHDPPHVWRLGWIMDYPDPDAIMSVWLSNSGNNHTRWKSQEYDKLVLEASVEKEPARRQELYDRAQLLLCKEDAAVIPLYTYTINMVVNPRVKNFPQNAMDLLDLRRTTIED